MPHREERDFQLTLHLSASFADDYEGDEDGFGWHDRFGRELRPKLVAAIFDVLRSDPRLRAVAAPRGRDPDRALDIDVEVVP